jgi:tRNA A37 methylthiotransferase MiaB
VSRSPSSISAENKKNKKIKILLYHCDYGTWIYPTALQLKTYIDLLYPATAEKLEWLIPLQNEVGDEELLQHIKQNKVDILCTSHYLWNHDYLTNQLCRIKDRLHDQTVIAGGPSIDVNVNEKFFQQHPYIDYAVYGAGEQAFADIVNHLVLGSPMIAFNTSNCAWQNSTTGKTVVADYKFVKMLETSPFLHNETMFASMIQNRPRKDIWLSYTLTRGCPYACTFCDWNSGLGNKVSRRKNTYQQEIDLFQRAGATNIYLADANVGQYDEDVDMIEYFAEKNVKENAGFHVGGNFSKLKKENNLKIFHTMAQGHLVRKTFNFSVQEINQEVMKNINRPDVGWDVHLAMIEELTTSYPHLIAKVQLIYGLPGQTLDSWQQTLQTVTEKNLMPLIFLNEPLPASPAMYDPEYQKQFQFEYVYSQRISLTKYFSYIPKKSNSFDQADLVAMTVVTGVYGAMSFINLSLIENNVETLNIAEVVSDFLNSDYYKNLYTNLYENWTTENNFYFTKGIDQDSVEIPDTRLNAYLVDNNVFLKYLLKFVPLHNQIKFVKLSVNSTFKNYMDTAFSDFD